MNDLFLLLFYLQKVTFCLYKNVDLHEIKLHISKLNYFSRIHTFIINILVNRLYSFETIYIKYQTENIKTQ